MPRKEKGYQNHAWIILFVVAIFLAFYGLATIVSAVVETATRTAVEGATRGVYWGIWQTMLAIIVAAISRTSFRKGEKWAWYALCIFALGVATEAAYDIWLVYVLYSPRTQLPDITFSPLITAIAVVGLFLPYRKFFPKGRA